MSQPGTIASARGLEDAGVRAYTERMKRAVFDGALLSASKLAGLHSELLEDALSSFNSHHLLRTFQHKMVQEARQNLLKRIASEFQRLSVMNEERVLCQVMHASLDEQKARTAQFVSTATRLACEGAASQQAVQHKGARARLEADVANLQAHIDAMLSETSDVLLQNQQLEARMRGDDTRLQGMQQQMSALEISNTRGTTAPRRRLEPWQGAVGASSSAPEPAPQNADVTWNEDP